MATGKPLGRMGIVGRRPAARHENVKLIGEVVELLPLATVVAAVERYYGSGPVQVMMNQAFADPIGWLPELTPEQVRALEEELGSPSPRAAHPRIEDEARLAQRELVKYWINSLLAAWTTFGERRGKLMLNERLLPTRLGPTDRDGSRWTEWNKDRKDALRAILSSIAVDNENLSPDGDLAAIENAFLTGAKKKLRQDQALALPDSLQVFAPAPDVAVLTRRPAQVERL